MREKGNDTNADLLSFIRSRAWFTVTRSLLVLFWCPCLLFHFLCTTKWDRTTPQSYLDSTDNKHQHVFFFGSYCTPRWNHRKLLPPLGKQQKVWFNHYHSL